MTDVASLSAYAGELSEAAARANASSQKQHDIINGDDQADVVVEFGVVPSLMKQSRLAQEKVTSALIEVASQMSGALTYKNTDLGLLGTVSGGYFSVKSVADDRLIDFYLNEDGAAVYQDSYPNAHAVKDVLKLVGTNDDDVIQYLLDDLGFAWGMITEEGFSMPGLKAGAQSSSGTTLYDPLGFVIFEDTEDRTSFGALSWCYVPYDGIWVMDSLGFVASDLLAANKTSALGELPSGIPYLATEVCGVDGVSLSMYVDGFLAKRSDTDPTRVTLAAELNPVIVTSSEALRFIPSELGGAAKLHTRPLRGAAASRTVLDLAIKSAPNPPAGPAPAPRILLLADSIGNHQGPMLLNQFLRSWGYAPKFIGTYPSSISESVGWNRLGLLGEARQGWSGSEYTNAATTRQPIAPGAEAVYLAGTKPFMSGYNPFLRAATGADPLEFVKNGYIFDPAFYQQRFGLETPDIVIIGLGTNDIRDQSADSIYNTIYENDILFYTQCRAAWPNAKIIRCMPGTARNSGVGSTNRDALWSSHYIPAIRAILDARKHQADAKISVASSWAFYSPEVGYTLNAGVTDPTTGAITTTIDDYLHPQGSSRRQYYQYLSGHVACAAVGLI